MVDLLSWLSIDSLSLVHLLIVLVCEAWAAIWLAISDVLWVCMASIQFQDMPVVASDSDADSKGNSDDW